MAEYGGWTGNILRVNLTTGKTSVESTEKYFEYIGGLGIGYKVLWDEVPAGTGPHDSENKIVFAVGPITGTGAVCSGRTNITSISPLNPFKLVADSHVGGYLATEIKYAGWDAFIIEGKSDAPVWLRIEDDKVSIENAGHMWGKGCFDTMATISGIMGDECQCAVIGQAGENLVPLSFIRNGSSHHSGGHGSVLGSKMLKGIGIKGTGSVKIAGKSADWMKVVRENLTVIGANNQHVVPRNPQPWAEFTAPTRWTSGEGVYWGAANPPVETGITDPKDMNAIGFRTHKALLDLTGASEKYTVRMGGCASCPIRCHSQVHLPQLERYGVHPYVSSTCVGFFSPGMVMIKGVQDMNGEGTMIARALGAQITNDYGIWCNYLQITKDFKYAYNHGVLKKVLPAEEYASIPWDLLEDGDPAFLKDFYRRIAFQEGEFCHIGDGAGNVARRWNFGDDYWNDAAYSMWNKIGVPKHHSNESDGQVGSLISLIKNRDAQNHSHQNFLGSGLPLEIKRSIAAEVWGGGEAVDEPSNYTPINQPKVNFAKWSIVKNFLHDMLTICNWMFPMTVSPLKERDYRGNTGLEAEYFSLATGVQKSEEELDKDAEKLVTLHRAMTIKQMNTVNMREEHDHMNDWIFDMNPDKEPFTPGTIKMDREDMEKAKTMLYEAFGWDPETGAPTRACLEDHGLKYVADELDELGLLPA